MSPQITTQHPASSYGAPVCLIDGEPADDKDGLKACLKELGWTQKDLAKHCNVAYSTARGYACGQCPVPAEVWNVLRDALEDQRSPVFSDGGAGVRTSKF